MKKFNLTVLFVVFVLPFSAFAKLGVGTFTYISAPNDPAGFYSIANISDDGSIQMRTIIGSFDHFLGTVDYKEKIPNKVMCSVVINGKILDQSDDSLEYKVTEIKLDGVITAINSDKNLSVSNTASSYTGQGRSEGLNDADCKRYVDRANKAAQSAKGVTNWFFTTRFAQIPGVAQK